MSSDAALAAQIAAEAGRLLVELRAHRHADVSLGDLGDARSNELIVSRLTDARPGDSVLSEESTDDPARLDADRVWIVDPLDGTREYAMAGRTDWAVHVALWQRGSEIVASAVALPALDVVLSTDDAPGRAPTSLRSPRIVVSDSRPPAFMHSVAEKLDADVIPMGSAGAKAMAVVRGDADAYVHAGGQWEWDSAAPVGVALAAGLHASRLDGSAMRYNQPRPYLPDLVICDRAIAQALLHALAESEQLG